MQQHSLSRSSHYCSTLLVARMKDDTSLIWLNFKFFRKLMTVALLLISISHDGRPGKICGHNTLNCQFESHFYPQDVSRQGLLLVLGAPPQWYICVF